ncbi:MAG TPA: tRNA (adenosine(37)-N6)-threonylcarbamoyltransferase complex dimerization subunit type 1 TsaB, partial [Mesorhizobium sp.]
GLALALKIPAIGVTTLEALAQQARQAFPGRAVLVALDGGRDEIHAALYDEAAILRYGPAVATMAEMVEMASTNKPVLAGTAAMKIADAATGPFNGGPFDIGTTDATSDIAVYARLAATKSTGEKPHPVYLRAADAKPQAGFVLPRIS